MIIHSAASSSIQTRAEKWAASYVRSRGDWWQSDGAHSSGRYMPPNGIGARASPSMFVKMDLAMTMTGRRRTWARMNTCSSSRLSNTVSASVSLPACDLNCTYITNSVNNFTNSTDSTATFTLLFDLLTFLE